MNSMLGAEVYFGYGEGENRVEDSGTIQDKVRMTDVIKDESGKVVGVSQHDIYLLKKKDGSFANIHPLNLIKVL